MTPLELKKLETENVSLSVEMMGIQIWEIKLGELDQIKVVEANGIREAVDKAEKLLEKEIAKSTKSKKEILRLKEAWAIQSVELYGSVDE